MPICPNTWLREFLTARQLQSPDGRPLYAYRCSYQEFESLTEVLSARNPYSGSSQTTVRAFVLYASEWWQRRYDGRQWAWEPLLAPIGWRWVQYSDLYAPVKRAWAWWGVDLVRLPAGVRYLGTFACQGGLPLALVGNADHRITRYLRAVLKHTVSYRQFVDDPIELARDQQQLLRPPTLRRDYVFRLAADLIEAVIDLESDAEGDNPLKALDQTRPDWRDTMPLDLEDERAQDLLTGLLREATRGSTDRVEHFRLERFLRCTGKGGRLGARVLLPPTIPADGLARQLGVSQMALPQRLQVYLHGERVRIVGMYGARSDDYLLIRGQQSSLTEVWNEDAASEVRLQFRSGDEIGEPLVPYRGSALSDLPWVFHNDRHECIFLGEGSVSNRSPELVVLVPDDCEVENGVAVDMTAGRVLTRVLWRVSEPTIINTASGRCAVRPSSGHQAEEQEYRLSGQRFYDLNCAWPVFRNIPKLRVAKAEQPHLAVNANEVSWRQTGRDWQQSPDTDVFGLWEIRHVRGSELRHYGRVVILPKRFHLSLEPGADISEGHLLFNGAEAVKVSVDGADTEWDTKIEGDKVRVHIVARDKIAPPVRLRLLLHWQGATALVAQVPFPGHGARFLQGSRSLNTQAVAVDGLYGVRAMALSPNSAQQFWIEGALKAPDLRDLLRVAHFRRPLRKYGVTHELALIEVRPMIEQMLAASSSNEVTVALRIVDKSQREYASTVVSRFAAALDHDTSMAFVAASHPLEDHDGTTVACEALPLARPSDEPIPLSIVCSDDDFHGAVLPQELNMNEPWLVVVRHDDGVRIRPTIVGGRSNTAPDVRDAETPHLSEAMSIADPELRESNIGAAMDAIMDAGDADRVEYGWSFLNDALLCAADLPATAFDLLKVLTTKPKLLVRCLFKLERTHRQLLWQLEQELPFSWLLIERNIWWDEAKGAFDLLRNQLAGAIEGDHGQIAHQSICSIIGEGVEHLPALNTVATDIALRLGGSGISESLVRKTQQIRDEQTPTQVRLRVTMDDWPMGYGRREWAQELDPRLEKLPVWQHTEEHRSRQPIFDTPVAAAWCCIFTKPTPLTTFLVKRIRAHDPEWFDLAYSAAWLRFACAADRQ
ncbi:MAG: STY4851/ECs_5259 family protein [Rhodospirillaceae bacterium]|nr:STY4851/ECs_5259 family protein [Rhodospirillaceae bacterium]